MQVSLNNSKPMPLKWHMLLAVLPKYDWNVAAAAQSEDIGYSASYANTRLPVILRDDVRFCNALKERRAEFRAKTDITVTHNQQKLEEIANEAQQAGKFSAAVAARVANIKTLGGFMADKPTKEGLAARALDLAVVRELNELGQVYLERRYNGIDPLKAIDATIISDADTNPDFQPDNEGT